ncbi:MAG TPA: S9 family peptidase [Candidatus Krumholzibacteria bacterium]
MRRTALCIVSVLVIAAAASANQLSVRPPVAAKEPHYTVTNGDTLFDNYFWMRHRENPEVIRYLEAENAYTDEVMAPTKPLQEQLYKEMLGRIQETDTNVPFRRGGYFYYSRTEQGKQYSIQCRRKGSMDAPEEVLLDLNAMGEGLPFISMGDMEVSDDANFLAFSIDTTGYRQYELQVKDLRSGEILPDRIPRVTSVAWAADNKTIFYTQEDAVSKRSNQAWRHVVGAASDEMLYEEKDELYDIWLYRTRSDAYILMTAASSTTSEQWYLAAADPAGQFKSMAGRVNDREYYADHAGDRFFIRTNDKGRNFRLVSAPVAAPGTGWKQILPHRDGVMLEDIDCFKDFYVTSERENGVPTFHVTPMAGGKSHQIEFPEPVYVARGTSNYEFDTPVFRFSYESFVTPSSVFDYNMQTRERELRKQQPVLGGYDPKNYRSERVYAKAKDGTKVPVSIVYRVDPKEKSHPRDRAMLLMGYGSYGISMDVRFSSNVLSLLDRGMIYGIAHIRGGGELGKKWHEEGRMMEKKNTFTDFIACCDHLVKAGYTTRDRLAIMGGSAGGLLMGAVLNMRPDVCRAALVYVPFVDVMNTMLDASLPLTTGEYLEWGNPNEKPAYEYMKSYSPYDNVKHQRYPIMLVRTSLNDSQVPYWESSKWVAKLREYKQGDDLLLLKAKLEPGGHGGASGRYDKLHDTAFDYAFLLTELGIAPLPQ